jgi:ankyrin repeat protein
MRKEIMIQRLNGKERLISQRPDAKRPREILPSERPALSSEKQEALNNQLLRAAKDGNDENVFRLITAGADITSQDNVRWTTLHHAAWNGNTQTCAMLIGEYAKSGGDVKDLIAAKNEDLETALHCAAYDGYTQTCVLLLREYANAGGSIRKLISAKDRAGDTAIYFASHSGFKKTVQFLDSIKKLSSFMGRETFRLFMKSLGDCASQ